jgi:hypothetical protein
MDCKACCKEAGAKGVACTTCTATKKAM